MSAAKMLENMGILIFHGDGTPKSTEEILKEIQEKIIINTKGDEVMTNKYENRETQDGRVYLRDIIGNLIKIKESLFYEIGIEEAKGNKEKVNYLKQASLKLDIGICDLKNIDEDFEYKICEINKAIDALSEAAEKIQTLNTIHFLKMDVIGIKDKIENEIEKLKSFDEMFNGSEKIETTETDHLVETSPLNINPNVTLTGNKVNNDFEEYAEQGKLNVSEAINTPKVELKGKDLTDEAILNENIETMRKEIKQIVSDKLLNIEPMEKAETITKLSKEIRKCISMKNYIEISNRHRANEDDR